MAECEVIISMSLLKVEISRPWLHTEFTTMNLTYQK